MAAWPVRPVERPAATCPTLADRTARRRRLATRTAAPPPARRILDDDDSSGSRADGVANAGGERDPWPDTRLAALDHRAEDVLRGRRESGAGVVRVVAAAHRPFFAGHRRRQRHAVVVRHGGDSDALA